MTATAPLARYGALSGFVPACREAGVDPEATMRAHGLDPARLAEPDAWADAAALTGALESAAGASGCPTLGLRMSRLRPISSLGPVSLALQAEPTLRAALDLLARFWPSHNQALRLSLRDEGDHAVASLRLELGADVPHVQATELAAGVLRLLAQTRTQGEPVVLGARFRHPAPVDTGEHEAAFVAGVAFGASEDAVLLRDDDLDAVAADDDPQQRAYAQRFLASLASAEETTRTEQVRRLVTVLLPTGRCSAPRVAASLGVERRTLQRWLGAEGETFGGVVTQVRRDRAEGLLTQGRQSLIEIADELGFTEPSSFSRWFAGEYGVSPSAWQRRR